MCLSCILVQAWLQFKLCMDIKAILSQIVLPWHKTTIKCTRVESFCVLRMKISSIIGTDQPFFLGVCRDVQRGVQASTGCRTN